MPTLPLWVLLGVLLVAPPHNRHRQAWLILVLPLGIAGLGALVGLAGPSDNLDIMFFFLTWLSIAWASVWLAAPWLRARRRAVRALAAWCVMAVVGVVGYFCYYGTSLSGDTTGVWAGYGSVFSATLVVAMMLSGYSCRRSYRMIKFMFWLALWMPVAFFAGFVILLFFIAVAIEDPQVLLGLLCSGVGVTLIMSSCLYVLNVPVMVLVHFSPFYRERFHALFCPIEPAEAFEPTMPERVSPFSVSTDLAGDAGEGESPFAPPTQTEPRP